MKVSNTVICTLEIDTEIHLYEKIQTLNINEL